MLQSFIVAPDGALSAPVDTISSGGGSPAFASPLSTGEVVVMNYGGGNGRIIPTTSDSLHFDASAPSAGVITFPVPQGGVSHPHSAYEFGQEVLVPDLGADQIWRLGKDASGSEWKIDGSLPQPTGSGPRHAVIQDNVIFTVHELSSTLTAEALSPVPDGGSTLLASTSIVPTDSAIPAGVKFAAAEILIPPALPFQASDAADSQSSQIAPTDASAPDATTDSLSRPTLLYASNRNIGVEDPRGDSIAIFQFFPGRGRKAGFKLVQQVYTGLQQIRGMSFNQDGTYLIAGGVKSGGVKVFKRTNGGLALEEVASNDEIDTRTSFVWL